MKYDKRFTVDTACHVNGHDIVFPSYHPDPKKNMCVVSASVFYDICYKGEAEIYKVEAGKECR